VIGGRRWIDTGDVSRIADGGIPRVLSPGLLAGAVSCAIAAMTESDPRDADSAWTAALLARDVVAAGAILHDGYALVLVHPVAALVDRREWLRTLPDYVVSGWDVRGSAWDICGDVASHLQMVDQTAVALGNDRSGLFAITDTWLRDADGSWKVWRRHSTPMTAGAIPRITP
jgi:Domain of unknown function (DUF4440)